MNEKKGFIRPNTDINDFNRQSFLIRQKILTLVESAFVALVQNVDEAAHTVDVLPLVKGVDGDGNAIDTATIYNIPFFILQGGQCAVLVTPAIGDIGIVAVCRDDSSAALLNKSASVPPSNKKFNKSNGIYLSSVASTTSVAQHFIRVSPEGIAIQTTSKASVQCADADVTASGSIEITSSGSATVTAATVNVNGDVNLGAEGGQPVARVGDAVQVDPITHLGTITSGAAKVKAV